MTARRLRLAAALGAALLCAAAGARAAEPAKKTEPVKNIVLVHGAFVDGSGWRPVYDILTRDGYAVSIVQQPLTGFAEDVAAVKRVLARQHGPVILVGHSYGGALITEVGTDPLVAGLVYIAAHAPDKGESEAQLTARYPAPGHDAIKTTPDDYAYIDPTRFHAEFAADLSTGEAAFEASSQVFTAAGVFIAPITNPAWRSKPSWYMVAKGDRMISPELERMYAARAHSQVVEIDGASHSVYRSHPKEVAALIEEAAKHALDGK
jgi:pimeloyl-ACP methyl ester carboxylesterase